MITLTYNTPSNGDTRLSGTYKSKMMKAHSKQKCFTPMALLTLLQQKTE